MFDDVLNALEVSLEPFALCQIRGPNSMGLGRRTFAILHYVIAGSGSVVVDHKPPIKVEHGSVVLVAAFCPHGLRGEAPRGDPLPDCKPLDASFIHLKTGAGEDTLAAVCGQIEISYRGLSGTLNLLRSPIIEHLSPDDRVRRALDDFVQELASPKIGSRALARALLQQCVIILLRRRFSAGDPSLRWMQGISEEPLWAAMQVMLDRPEQDHSVESLANLSGMSRATFAKRFQHGYGRGPMELLRTIRLRRAAELLTGSNLPVKRIAELVGYQSRSYFTRAFEAEHGAPPDLFRKSVER
ncbi:MAG: AraC family transcriptional regulator [Pseudomonadota bacterium]